MQPEHAHLDMNYGVPYEPRVSHEEHVKQIATKALEKVQGAKELIESSFDRSKWDKPFELPAKRHMNQAMHLGWG